MIGRTLGQDFEGQLDSKAVTYWFVNRTLSVHKAYATSDYIDKRERLEFTMFRLSSHRLKIETGRWARLDVKDRLCGCGEGIQDVSHVLFRCAKTEEIRRRFDVHVDEYKDLGGLMDSMDVHNLVPFVYHCMKVFG